MFVPAIYCLLSTTAIHYNCQDLEEDPLEAFMKGLAPQAAAPAAAPSAAAASGATGPAGRAGARGKNVGLDEDDDHGGE